VGEATFWRRQLSTLGAQAEEMRSLSTQVTTDVAAPIKAQVTRGMEELRKPS
jgi:hypothetical protein